MPDRAEEDRRQAWDRRHATIDYSSVGIAGTCQVTGELDLADALDLDQALAADAQHQADLGSSLTLDQRRSVALVNLARRDLVLHYPAHQESADPTPRRTRPREVVLHVHLAEAALTGTSTDAASDPVAGASGGVGRVENTRTPVSVQTIRSWCGHPDARVVVKPVRDLAEHVHVEAYEVGDRIPEDVALRDLSCVFPWCTRPARRLQPHQHPADCDHQTAYADGGTTCTCQIAPLCRRHHRLKTHGGWTYHTIEPGSYLWTSPHRYQYLRDHTGTLDATPDQPHPHQPPPPET